MFILGFLISDVAFGQSLQAGLTKYKQTLLRGDVRSLLPDFLKVFNGSKAQKDMQPQHVGVLLGKPIFLRTLVPETDNQFIALLYLDKDFRALFGADPFYRVLKSSNEIDRLLNWFDAQPALTEGPGSQKVTTQPRATTLEIVSGNNQSDEVGKFLAQPLVVGVLDQDGKPLEGIEVAFTVTAGSGQISGHTIHTDVYGQAQTTLTLGSRAGLHSVMARAAGITRTQTFTATAVAPPPPKEPEPVVPVRSSTEEPPMYWIAGNTIYYRPTGGGKEIFKRPQPGTLLTGGLAVDMGGGKVYWTEETSDNMGRIQSADLDGTNIQPVKETIAVPYDIAFDAEKRRLYWTNFYGKIQRINVNGRDFKSNFITGLKEPRHIAFDVEKRRLHWTEMDADGIWSIYNTSVDHVDKGTAMRRRLDKEDLGEVRGIAVFDDVVYWTDQTSSGGRVRFVNRTMKDDKKLLAVLEEIIPGGIAVDPGGGKVYWTTSHGIQNVSLTNAQTVTIRGGVPAGIALGGTAAAPAAPAAPSISPVVSVENTLLANYPNPFNPETWIPYQLSASADVSVSIYAVDGRLVRRLDLGHQVEGVYRSRSRAAYWDGRNEFGERVASGLYFYTLTAGDFTATRKMLIRK